MTTAPLTREQKAAALGEPFPDELLRVNKDKHNITYVPIAEVIARLNRVLGVGEWSYKVVDRWTSGEKDTGTGTFPTWLQAHVTLRYRLEHDDPFVETDGIGGQAVKFRRDGTDVLDLGDDWKGAVSDALKKSTQSIGVGLDLARKDEALEWQRRQDEENEPPPAPEGWESRAAHDAARAALGERIKALPDDYRGEIVEWFRAKGGEASGWSWPLSRDRFDEYEREVADAEATLAALAGAGDSTGPSEAKGAGVERPAEGTAPAPDTAHDGAGEASTEGSGPGGRAADPPKDPSPPAQPPVEELESKAADILASIEKMSLVQKRAMRTWCASNEVPVAADGNPDLINIDPDQLARVFTYVASAA